MTKGQVTATAKEHKLGILLLGLGIAGWAGSQYIGEWFSRVDLLSAVSTLAGAYDIIQQRRTKAAAKEVKEGVVDAVQDSVPKALSDEVYTLSLAVVRVGSAVDTMRETGDQRHRENSDILASIAAKQTDLEALHAEHIAVTDSHGAAIGALGEAVKEMKPEFVLPPLHQRRSPS